VKQLAKLRKFAAQDILNLRALDIAPWLRSHLNASQELAHKLVASLPPDARTAEAIDLCLIQAKCKFLADSAIVAAVEANTPARSSLAFRDSALSALKEARQTVLTRSYAVDSELARQTAAGARGRPEIHVHIAPTARAAELDREDPDDDRRDVERRDPWLLPEPITTTGTATPTPTEPPPAAESEADS
jgi:hypothetical protein